MQAATPITQFSASNPRNEYQQIHFKQEVNQATKSKSQQIIHPKNSFFTILIVKDI